jgi:hypothetical protein
VRSLPEETLRQSPQLSEAHYEAAWRTGQWDVGDDSGIVEGSGGSGHFHQVYLSSSAAFVVRPLWREPAQPYPESPAPKLCGKSHKTAQERHQTLRLAQPPLQRFQPGA